MRKTSQTCYNNVLWAESVAKGITQQAQTPNICPICRGAISCLSSFLKVLGWPEQPVYDFCVFQSFRSVPFRSVPFHDLQRPRGDVVFNVTERNEPVITASSIFVIRWLLHEGVHLQDIHGQGLCLMGSSTQQAQTLNCKIPIINTVALLWSYDI